MSQLGQKHDTGKIQAATLFEYFPDALLSVAEIATYGANKYTRNGWKDVPNKEQRYADAFFRHLLANYSGEKNDPESGLAHKAHAAWNALALLQMEIENNKEDIRYATGEEIKAERKKGTLGQFQGHLVQSDTHLGMGNFYDINK